MTVARDWLSSADNRVAVLGSVLTVGSQMLWGLGGSETKELLLFYVT